MVELLILCLQLTPLFNYLDSIPLLLLEDNAPAIIHSVHCNTTFLTSVNYAVISPILKISYLIPQSSPASPPYFYSCLQKNSSKELSVIAVSRFSLPPSRMLPQHPTKLTHTAKPNAWSPSPLHSQQQWTQLSMPFSKHLLSRLPRQDTLLFCLPLHRLLLFHLLYKILLLFLFFKHF